MPRLYGVSLLLAVGTSAASKMHVGSTFNCSKMISYVRPVYPKEAKRRHIQGVVKLRAVVTVKGERRNIGVLEGDPVFVPAALRAAKKCRFSPCLLDGDPIEVKTYI